MAAVTEFLARIQEKFPNIAHSLRPPATPGEMRDAETQIGLSLPDPLRILYSVANGQRWDECHQAALFIDGYFLVSLQDVVDTWRLMNRIVEEQGQSPVDVDDSRIQPMWWCAGWIPFAQDGSSGYLACDMGPAGDGTLGQIVCGSKYGIEEFVAPGLDAYCRIHVDGLANDTVRWNPEYQMFEQDT